MMSQTSIATSLDEAPQLVFAGSGSDAQQDTPPDSGGTVSTTNTGSTAPDNATDVVAAKPFDLKKWLDSTSLADLVTSKSGISNKKVIVVVVVVYLVAKHFKWV